MTQPTLFDLNNIPCVHTADPPTSRAAAATHTASGRRERNADLVLGLVRRFPESTACELWELTTESEQEQLAELQECRRRLTDLQAIGKVVTCGARACRVRGTSQTVWRVTT